MDTARSTGGNVGGMIPECGTFIGRLREATNSYWIITNAKGCRSSANIPIRLCIQLMFNGNYSLVCECGCSGELQNNIFH